VIKKYNCQDINPSVCQSKPVKTSYLFKSQWQTMILAVLALLVLFGGITVFIKRKK
jgi:hypothetical protein